MPILKEVLGRVPRAMAEGEKDAPALDFEDVAAAERRDRAAQKERLRWAKKGWQQLGAETGKFCTDMWTCERLQVCVSMCVHLYVTGTQLCLRAAAAKSSKGPYRSAAAAKVSTGEVKGHAPRRIVLTAW
eukprot:scaffold65022_cov20-Tisochrysis_lutea.AAC.2